MFSPLRRSDPEFFEFDWTALLIPTRVPGKVYALNEIAKPALATGFYLKCTTPGMAAHHPPIFPREADLTVGDGSLVWTMVEPGGAGLPTISGTPTYDISPAGIAQSDLSTVGLVTRVKLDAVAAGLGEYEILAEIVSSGEDYSMRTTLEVVD